MTSRKELAKATFPNIAMLRRNMDERLVVGGLEFQWSVGKQMQKKGLVHLSFGWFYPLTIPGVNPQLQFSLTWENCPADRGWSATSARHLATTKGFQSWFTGPLVLLIGLVWSDPSRTTPLFWPDLECNFHWGSTRNPPQQPYMFWIFLN